MHTKQNSNSNMHYKVVCSDSWNPSTYPRKWRGYTMYSTT